MHKPRLLTIDIGSYTHGDFLLTLDRMGIEHDDFFYHFPRGNADLKYDNPEFEALFSKKLGNAYDAVYTTNFYPVIARICHEKGIRYIAWSYDSPINLPDRREMEHDTNFVFLFDRNECKKYNELGYDNFYHLPLAVNCDRLDKYTASDKFVTDVSFMGQLYESTLDELKTIMTPEQKKLINEIVDTQQKISSRWFVDDILTDGLIRELNEHFRALSEKAIQITKEQLSYSIAQQITHIDRIGLLRLISKAGIDIRLYTYPLTERERILLEGIDVYPPVSYGTEMPCLFKSSKINLNPTLRNITSGISLRALDIIGCGGFLLINEQPEAIEAFENGKEAVFYSDLGDALEKVKYYLVHDEERKKVAYNGYLKARRDFNYEDRISFILRTTGLAPAC
mgnify:CR=1 FL=1